MPINIGSSEADPSVLPKSIGFGLSGSFGHKEAGTSGSVEFFYDATYTMRFFVPGANNTAHGESLYQQTRGGLRSQGVYVSDRRICRVKFTGDDKTMNVAVGDSLAGRSGSVFAIFETGYGIEIYTSAYPPAATDAMSVRMSDILDIEDFTAIA